MRRDVLALGTIIAMALAAGTPSTADTTEVAYDALTNGNPQEAIAQLEEGDRHDPARLINLAAAYLATGRTADAREAYKKAAVAERYELETVDGEWIDSRVLARAELARTYSVSFEQSRMARVD
ncbi:hypothetical protein AB433_06480 [Croceicoccus naphthovorans]|uniref:Tetratricopeptide repeat protein n=1 Tax=Croceicoccus naphthovorans TaxID=1348774 RepID=A0A0G3XK84_9SPHN|nr:hypothetical protein AB433_06480 [Croceicoccus naphthovorans]